MNQPLFEINADSRAASEVIVNRVINAPHPMDAIIARNKLADEKHDDVIKRLNEEIAQGPLAGYLEFIKYGVTYGSTRKYRGAPLHLPCGRKFTIVRYGLICFFSSNTPPGHKFRLTNRTKAYLGYLTDVLNNYTQEIDNFYTEHSL